MQILPAVAVIIFDAEGRVLLQKRADVNRWGLISGHVEPGETVAQAAIREVKEETGLTIRIKRLIGVYSDPESQTYDYPDGRRVHYITTYLEGEPSEAIAQAPCSETLEVGYFAPDQLPTDLLRMHPDWLKDATEQRAQSALGTFLR